MSRDFQDLGQIQKVRQDHKGDVTSADHSLTARAVRVCVVSRSENIYESV